MTAHIDIDETTDGWQVHESGLEGKHVVLDFHPGGIDIDITADDQPLRVQLGQPITEGTSNV